MILIIDDEDRLRRSIALHLEDADYLTAEAANGQEGLDALRRSHADVLAVVVDLNMPVMDGYGFIEHAVREFPNIPIVVLSGVGIIEDALTAIRIGAWDFITKPLRNFSVLDHVLGKVMERARLVRENREYQENLEQMVRERTAELEDTRRQIMQRLCRAAEYRDNETGHHVVRVAKISRLLASTMGLGDHHCEMIGDIAPLHDVGKIGIPDGVLLKPGRLDAEEWAIMRQHCLYGCEILGPLDSKGAAQEVCSDPLAVMGTKDSEQLKLGRLLALCHHERWDGKGYPFGLSGEEIPIEARIVAVVDVFDALCSVRPYKTAMESEKAVEIIRQGAGTQFDPVVVSAFFARFEDICAIRARWSD